MRELNTAEIEDAKAFIDALQYYINTAQAYINGEYEKGEMDIHSLINKLREDNLL